MALNYQFDKKRFEAFIDAIFAILLTILVLEIRIPEEAKEQKDTYHQVVGLVPVLVSYVASFLLIVGFWIDYHLLFQNITHISKPFIMLNMLFILSLSFAPFVTAFGGVHYKDHFAVALLGFSYFVMNIIFGCIYWYAMVKKLTDPNFWPDNKATAIYANVGIVVLLASVPLAYVNTYISFALFLIVFSGHLVKKR